MKKLKIKLFEIPDAESRDIVLNHLGRHFRLQSQKLPVKKIEFTDTFDQRLFKKNWLFIFDSGLWRLINIKNLKSVFRCEEPGNKKLHSDFGDKSLRNFLNNELEERALIHKKTMNLSIEDYSLTNQDQKTVVRIRRYFSTEIQSIELFQLEEMRGYGDAFARADSILSKLTFPLMPDTFKKWLIPLIGLAEEPYSAKFTIKLKPNLSVNKAAQKILIFLTDIIQINEKGILEDIDIEFLHDHRVAIRKTRSLLTQIKEIFPPADYTNYKKSFSGIQKKSNVLRDMDVYLLKEKEYRSKLPDLLKNDTNQLFSFFRRERKKEWRQYVKLLKSPAYKRVIDEWQQFLKILSSTQILRQEPAPAILKAAKLKIRKKFSRLRKVRSGITGGSPDKALHDLRLECKEMRYLLDFFTSLFPPDVTAPLGKGLKKLQDILGLFNDLSVQQAMLDTYLNQATNISPRSAAAIGALISRLHQEHQQVRDKSMAELDRFLSQNSADNVKELFG